jgi:hypothetical protein
VEPHFFQFHSKLGICKDQYINQYCCFVVDAAEAAATPAAAIFVKYYVS